MKQAPETEPDQGLAEYGGNYPRPHLHAPVCRKCKVPVAQKGRVLPVVLGIIFTAAIPFDIVCMRNLGFAVSLFGSICFLASFAMFCMGVPLIIWGTKFKGRYCKKCKFITIADP